jgi:hypothetical protein
MWILAFQPWAGYQSISVEVGMTWAGPCWVDNFEEKLVVWWAKQLEIAASVV